MFEWLSEQRSIVALLLILGLLGGFFASIVYGVRQTRRLAKDQVLVIRNVQLVAGSGRSVAFRRCCWCGFTIHGGQRALFFRMPPTSFVRLLNLSLIHI